MSRFERTFTSKTLRARDGAEGVGAAAFTDLEPTKIRLARTSDDTAPSRPLQ
jgi:hypothetical protein